MVFKSEPRFGKVGNLATQKFFLGESEQFAGSRVHFHKGAIIISDRYGIEYAVEDRLQKELTVVSCVEQALIVCLNLPLTLT
jgi:hypothetical protein